jgi:hypothetical protein
MLKYLSNKTSDVGNRPNNSNNAPIKPRYRGPDPQTNRYEYELSNTRLYLKYNMYLDLICGLVIDGMVLIDQMALKINYLHQLLINMFKLKELIYGM